jgi:hypothetical protein
LPISSSIWSLAVADIVFAALRLSSSTSSSRVGQFKGLHSSRRVERFDPNRRHTWLRVELMSITWLWDWSNSRDLTIVVVNQYDCSDCRLSRIWERQICWVLGMASGIDVPLTTKGSPMLSRHLLRWVPYYYHWLNIHR